MRERCRFSPGVTDLNTEAPSSSGSARSGLIQEASHTENQYREVHERLERGTRPVHPIAEPAEALEPTDGAFCHVAPSEELSIYGVQLTDGLLGREPSPSRDVDAQDF